MNSTKWGLTILAAAVLVLGMGAAAYAFHSGGVAECVGCHSMHSPAAGGTSLLIGNDISSTCLSCHEHQGDTGPSSYHISTASADLPTGTPPKQRTPGGDFGWLRKSFTFVVRGATTIEDGATFGHNIVAVDKGYAADPTNTTAPGGTFPATQLACNSCHDPHGKFRRLNSGSVATTGAPIKASGSYNGASNEPDATNAVGVYRLLAGSGYQNTVSGVIGFPGVPAAKVPSTYNMTEASNQVRVAYGVATTGGHATWANWCATCHPAMHSTGNYVHPVDTAMSAQIRANYNAYVKSGDMTGSSTSSFNSLVPFATNSSNYATLASLANNNGSNLNGPASGDQVMCLSCHRAHATGNPEMLRWQIEGEFMLYNGNGTEYTGIDNGCASGGSCAQFSRGRTKAEQAAIYYDRPASQFASYQRVLCNKCHAKD